MDIRWCVSMRETGKTDENLQVWLQVKLVPSNSKLCFPAWHRERRNFSFTVPESLLSSFAYIPTDGCSSLYCTFCSLSGVDALGVYCCEHTLTLQCTGCSIITNLDSYGSCRCSLHRTVEKCWSEHLFYYELSTITLCQLMCCDHWFINSRLPHNNPQQICLVCCSSNITPA